MKSIFEKLFHGFLYGISFTIVLGGAYYYLTQKMASEAMSMYNFDNESIEVIEHRKIERDNKLLILGQVKNVSDIEVKGVTINVDLYLKGEFVKQCDERIKGGIPVGVTRNFELSCGGGCKTNPIVEHDSYEVFITGY